jgi:hypothetical protein
VSQTLQSLQDQQGKILSALLPLLPLLEAVPVHINSARSSINETVLKVSLESARAHRTPPPMTRVLRKRSFPAGPPSSPLLARKRPRLDPERTETTPNSMSGHHPHSSPRPLSRRPTLSTNNAPYFSAGSYPRLPQGYRTPLLPKPQRDPSIPRRPLGDLPIPSSLKPAQDQQDLHAHQTRPRLPQANSAPRSPPFLNAPSKGRPPAKKDAPQRPATASSPSPAPPPTISALPIVPPTINDAAAASLDTLATSAPSDPLAAKSDTPALVVRSTILIPSNQQPAPLPAKVTMVRGRRSPFVRVMYPVPRPADFFFNSREMVDGSSRWTIMRPIRTMTDGILNDGDANSGASQTLRTTLYIVFAGARCCLSTM